MNNNEKLSDQELLQIATDIQSSEEFVRTTYNSEKMLMETLRQDISKSGDEIDHDEFVALWKRRIWERKTQQLVEHLENISTMTNKSVDQLITLLGLEKIEIEDLTAYWEKTTNIAEDLLCELGDLRKEIALFIIQNKLPYCYSSDIKQDIDAEHQSVYDEWYGELKKVGNVDFQAMEKDARNKEFLEKLLEIQKIYLIKITGEAKDDIELIYKKTTFHEINELWSSLKILHVINDEDNTIYNMRQILLQTDELVKSIRKELGKKWYYLR